MAPSSNDQLLPADDDRLQARIERVERVPVRDADGRADESEPGDAPAEDTDRRARGLAPRTIRRSGPSLLALVLVAILAGTALFVGGFTLGARISTTPGTPANAEQQFSPFWDVYGLIQSRYAGSPRPSGNQLVEAAIDGMLKSLNDPWSYYQGPEDFKSALQSVGGQGEGIGVVVQIQPRASNPAASCTDKVDAACELAIKSVIPGAPAEKAGLKTADVIDGVDGTSLDGLTTDQITGKIKGKSGTTVTLRILRDGSPLQVTITRGPFVVPQTATRMLAGGQVEYISVSGINDNAAADFKSELDAGLGKGVRSYILDLRGNGGGYVNAAAAISSEFLNGGVVCYQQDASGKTSEVDASTKGAATDPKIRLVVLVDGNTASAAEILAGALQARGRAQLVGEKTYGKGVVQEWLPLPDNMGGIHLTVARWLTPSRVWINGKGLQPDVAVSGAGARAGTDPVLDAGLKALGYAAEPAASASPAPSASPAASPSPSPAISPSSVVSPSPSAS